MLTPLRAARAAAVGPGDRAEPSWGRALSAVLVLCAVAVAVFLGAPADSPAQVVAFFVPCMLAAWALTARMRTTPRTARGPLTLLWAAQLVYVGAMVVWYVAPVGLGWVLPFPSVLDAVFFGIYASYALVLTAVLRRRVADPRVEGRIALADSLILTTSVSTVLWVQVLEPSLAVQTAVLPRTVAILYPALNLLLFALAARLAVARRGARAAPAVLLLVWIGAELAGDVFYGTASATGTFAFSDPLSVTWMVAYAALAAFACHRDMVGFLDGRLAEVRARPGRQRWWPAGSRFAALAGLALAALVPLGLALTEPQSTAVLLASAAVIFALVAYRMSLLTGDLGVQRRLAAELQAALGRLGDQRDELARYAAMIASTDDSVVTVSLDGVITDWNHGAQRLYGYRPEEAIGRPVTMLIAPEHLAHYPATLATLRERGHVSAESVDVRKDGSIVHTLATISNIYGAGGELTATVGIARDITDRKLAERQAAEAARELETQARELQRLAYQDTLTGLGNRAHFTRRIAEAAAWAGDGDAPFALIMIDLDDFKVVNDSLGHQTGDALLQAAGARLSDVVGDSGIVTRLGGDEFAVIVDGGERAAVDLGEQILAAFARGFSVLGHVLHTTGSIGVTVGEAGIDPGILLRSADLAMYAAKAAGKGTLHVYQEGLLREAQRRLELQNHVRRAVQHGEMSLAYQPIADGATGELVGVEALARWSHPAWGSIPPDVFIPAAEASGAILAIGEWVVLTACHDAVTLGDARGQAVGVSVNVSVRQFQSPDFAAVVRQALDESGLAPALLTLEVTESLFMSEDPRHDTTLQELRGLGVRLSIDDFGTGHSSLARLRTLEVAELKIDRSFVSVIDPEGDCGPIITAVIAMARALGLSVVAEGVETAVQLAALQRLGCDFIQGYLIGRPMPLAAVGRLPARLMDAAALR